ncbi:hypothetical protein R80B4_02494 [Fibrobacteres bacterium R8-0-B4]
MIIGLNVNVKRRATEDGRPYEAMAVAIRCYDGVVGATVPVALLLNLILTFTFSSERKT